MTKKKSAFVLAGENNKDIIKTASMTKRNSLTTNEDIISAYDLQDGSRVSVICKVTRIVADVHGDDKGPIEGLPYVSFSFVPTSGNLKGSVISNFMPCYDRRSPEDGVSEKAMEWIFREFQGLGMDTEGWTLVDVESAADVVTEEQPMVALGINCSKIKSGKSKGNLAINVRINRLIVEGNEAPSPVKSSKPALGVLTPEPVVLDEDSDDEDTVDYIPKVHDEVTYTYEEDDDEEVLQCTITKVNLKSRTCDLSDGEYGYENVPFSEITPIE